jgi:hypothetical protein
MSGKTGIDWTDATWNYLPWRCRTVSPGCHNCYARKHTDRYQGAGAFESEPPARLRLHRLLLPLTDPQFRAGRRIFMESMSDPSGGVAILNRAICAGQCDVWCCSVCATDVGHVLPGPPCRWRSGCVRSFASVKKLADLARFDGESVDVDVETIGAFCPGCESRGRTAHTAECDERERAVARFLADIGA